MRAAAITVPDGEYIVDDLCDIMRWCASGPESFGLLFEPDGELTAFIIARFPRDGADNLGRDIKIADAELSKVVHMESVAVLPEYRGQGLQRKLVQRAESRAKKEGAVYSMCTVDPRNSISLDNFKELSYQVVAEKPKYGGHDRLILYKRLD
ncbi:MAG: GNAT family N-acetyltransferase [Actinomycetia bacterium]|nr:GNAT family N-acetyltransferase [Actinomycetes bacterium]